ncbi:MAG: hypothetical protein ACRD16_11320 [Thermoanaerobaculia bacterium]
MNAPTIDRVLLRLEEARAGKGPQARVESLIARLEKAAFRDAARLLRFHEVLLYFRAFPSRRAVSKRARRALSGFRSRVEELRAAGADLSAFDDSSVAGAAGTAVTMAFSYEMLRWLDRRCGKSLRIAWDDRDEEDDSDGLGATLPYFLPLLEEEALADANVPYPAWIDAARGRSRSLAWLLRRFEGLPMPREESARLFNFLGLPVEWKLGRLPLSRTALRLPGPSFFHGTRLLSGRDVSVRAELGKPRLRITHFSGAALERALDAARAALATRYRELHGFTHGEARGAVRADGSRGIAIYFFGLRPDGRLPLRAGFAHLVTRNGAPIGYGDGFTLFERVDLSFNIFPEYRDGESAFVFATLLKLYNQLLGSSTFSIEPYQIGDQNEEAIESGAFWFYRRLGFRPASAELERLALREEARIAADRSHRTSASVLRRLAGSNMLLETRDSRPGAWDRFHIRNLGLAVQREMARSGLSAERLRERCAERVARILSLRVSRRPETRHRALSDLALVLDRIPDLSRWRPDEKKALAAILDAKSGASEIRYVRLLQKHERLRDAVLRIGSARG